jgi:predicted nuclease of predicted toxin-antitoxin system
VLTTEEAGMDTASDEDQLAFAAKENRAILTFNIRDFAPLHEQWLADAKPHAGIIVSQQLGNRQYGVLLSRMLRLLDQMTAEEMQSNFVHLEQFK